MSTSFPKRVFDATHRQRVLVIAALAIAVVLGIFGTSKIPIDMSFRPTFTNDPIEIETTAAHERIFGQVGFRDLVAIADVKDASSAQALESVAILSARIRAIGGVVEVRDPTRIPFFDRNGVLQPNGLAGSAPVGRWQDSPQTPSRIRDLLRSPSWRRIIVGDHDRRLAVTASIDIPNEAFARRREVVREFRRVVRAWSNETQIETQITGYPEVEQVYADEVLRSVARSIAILVVTMIVLLLVYFRRWSDVLTCLAGVTLSVPVVLGAMALLRQPFSIVNSQVLTLVVIVGVGQALHHQEEYRRRREAGLDHPAANRDAFSLLAWPSLMTGFATTVGFAALATADMKAIRSFGLSTALGVVVVYLANWLVVPPLIHRFYRDAPAEVFLQTKRSWTFAVVCRADELLQRHPRLVAAGFAVVTSALVGLGARGLSIDQKVNEELPAEHSAVKAERTYEDELAGFLGPELSIAPESHDVRTVTSELVAFVNRLCDMPEVRYVASPLDLLPQSPVADGALGKACWRQGGDLGSAIVVRGGAAGPMLQALSAGVLSKNGDRAAVIVRVGDMGTAKSLPFVELVRTAARETMPHAVVRPVGQWWLAQQGMNRLSFDMMLSAITALLVILPIMWLAIRDARLFVAAIPPTVLPVVATLGFMGLTHISVRIGTAMILAIALGLAADDTIHLSVRIRDRVRSGSDPSSAVRATLLRTGRPCSFSSYVLIGGFASMTASSLGALQAMGVIAAFTMTFALASDVVLGPALYLLLMRRRREARIPVSSAASDGIAATVRGWLERVIIDHPERPAITYRCGTTPRGWRTLTWHEVARLVLDTADALDACAGTERTVAVLADTDARYPILELAVGLTGRALQPLYVESNDEELARALATTGAQMLVVGSSQRERAPAADLRARIVDLDALVRLPGVAGEPRSVLPSDVEPFDTRDARARLLGFAGRSCGAPLLYMQSTGTTGPARVIEIGEPAIVHAVRMLEREASHPYPRLLSFLPTAHISERLLTLYASLALAGHTWFGGGLASLAEDLRACRPTVLVAPPKLLSALRASAVAEARSSVLGRALLASVERTAVTMLASRVVGATRRLLGARAFGARLRRSAGLDHVRDTFSGTAPLPAALHAWFEAAGVPIRIVYGQTEMTGATSMTARRGARFGSVGAPLSGIEIRVADDGELLVRAPSLFTRYVGDEQASLRTLDGGWLHSGDRAELLSTGEIILLGRVHSCVAISDGTRVDTASILAAIESEWADAEVVVTRAPTRGLYLYVGLNAETKSTSADAVARAAMLSKVVDRSDPHRLIRGWAIIDGGFAAATGEVGPTGKPRGWRIQELRSSQLRMRAP
jgi:predicted RND superfamily exporter protein/long-subunit acyl-CoA synthetase (AMP-forming)